MYTFKSDLVSRNATAATAGGREVVGRDEGKEFASRNGFIFFEVSALTGTNVNAMIWTLLSAMIDDVPGADDELKERTIQNALVMCLDAGIEPPVRLKVRSKRERNGGISDGARSESGGADGSFVSPLSELQLKDGARNQGRKPTVLQKSATKGQLSNAGTERTTSMRTLSRT